MPRNIGYLLLLTALLLGTALRVPGWFTAEEKARWRLFEVDEEQHVAIAMHRYNELSNGVDTIKHRFHEPSYNVRGYGYVTAELARLVYPEGCFDDELPDDEEPEELKDYFAQNYPSPITAFGKILMLGRGLSTLFALLLVVVVFCMGRVCGLSPPSAGVAALLMAACDVNATYSHYMLPASGYIMFSYLALLGGAKLIRGYSLAGLTFLALGAAGAIAFKFDVFPTVWGGALLLFLVGRRYWGGGDGVRSRNVEERLDAGHPQTEGLREDAAHPRPTPHYARRPSGTETVRGLNWWVIPAALIGLAGFFLLLTYGWSWEEIKHSFTTLRKANKDVIYTENHFRDNLITYPMGVLAGIGLPAFGLAGWATVKLALGRWRSGKLFTFKTLALGYGAAFLLTEFALRWYMDTTFIRRVNIFMPAVALLAAYALQRLNAHPWISVLVIAWSVGLGVVGQSHHWFDTRIEMRDWANVYLPKPAKVAISASINIDGMRNWRYYLKKDWDYFITSEAFYRRYTKSMTTPFGVPECSNGVYHGGPADQCEDFQAMLFGTHSGVVLVKEFKTWDVFPERLLYHHLFGYYETFLGDVKVFRRVAPPENDRTTS